MELKNAFDGLTNRLDTAEEKISELEDMPTGTSKIEKLRKRLGRNKSEYPTTVGQLKRCNKCLMGVPGGEEKEKETKSIFEAMTDNSSPINVRAQTTHPRS